MGAGTVSTGEALVTRPIDFSVNLKRCRNCVYGREPFFPRSELADLERHLNGDGRVGSQICHNSPNQVAGDGPVVMCRGYYDKFKALIETRVRKPVVFTDLPDVAPSEKPIPGRWRVTKLHDEGVPMPHYDDQIADAKRRSTERAINKGKHHEARCKLIAQGTREIFQIIEEQQTAGKFTVSSVRKPEGCGEHSEFGLSLADLPNQVSYDIAATVSYGDDFDQVHPRFLRAVLRIIPHHPAVADHLVPAVVFIVHWRENGAVDFDLSAALVEAAQRLPIGTGQPYTNRRESSEGA